MSRTYKRQSEAGKEYWGSRLHKHGEVLGAHTKKLTHRKERREGNLKCSEEESFSNGETIVAIAVVRDDKLPCHGFKRVTILSSGDTTTECGHCGKTIGVRTAGHQIMVVFCCWEHFLHERSNVIPIVPIPPAEEAVKSSKPSKCPTCNGPSTRGRGFRHTEECADSPANRVKAKPKQVATCPKCGGPKRGRGFSHTLDCPTKQNGAGKCQN